MFFLFYDLKAKGFCCATNKLWQLQKKQTEAIIFGITLLLKLSRLFLFDLNDSLTKTKQLFNLSKLTATPTTTIANPKVRPSPAFIPFVSCGASCKAMLLYLPYQPIEASCTASQLKLCLQSSIGPCEHRLSAFWKLFRLAFLVIYI